MQKRLLAWRIFTRPSGPGQSTSRDVRVLNVECCPLSIHFLGLSLDLRSYEQFCDKTQKLKFLQLNFWQNLKQSFVLIGITWHLNNWWDVLWAAFAISQKQFGPPLIFFGPLKKRKIIVFLTLPSWIFFWTNHKNYNHKKYIWYCCYYPHTSWQSVSPVCRIFNRMTSFRKYFFCQKALFGGQITAKIKLNRVLAALSIVSFSTFCPLL